MVVFYKIWKKYNEIELKNKIDLGNLKKKNHPSSPALSYAQPTRFVNIHLH